MGQLDPERAETILNTLWCVQPGLLDELAVSAVDQEELSIGECASLLEISAEQVEERLIAFRRRVQLVDLCVVRDRDVAKLAQGQVAVWEVVREYRKLGSVIRLKEAFPALSEGELAAALIYAEEHPAEIEDKINEFETMVVRRRAEYPFVK
ncbi:MAG TPA: hypothetical protein VM328_00860 [Fimbriimonadaceae bacterium]|nr:hypothetical protein [Fimbriimonadaceae bacterium]